MKIENLIREAQNGNKIAFNKLITFYEQDLYKIARTRLNLDDACDAVQETIIKIYKSLNKLSKVSSFKSWMIKILINECNDIYRKNISQNIVSYENYENETYFIEKDFEEIDFNSLIKFLEYEERIIIVLFYLEGYKTREISKILNINHNTIRSKLLRAKIRIKEYLKEKGYEE